MRRLVVPALKFARHVPNLAEALDVGVREALAGGLMLVPSAADRSNTSNLLRVPNLGAAVVQHVSAVARAAESVASGVRTASAALSEYQARGVDPLARLRPRRAATPARLGRICARSSTSRRRASRRR